MTPEQKKVEEDNEVDDYALLVKYIAYVGDQEGVDFISGQNRDERFNEKEWAILEKAAKETLGD